MAFGFYTGNRLHGRVSYEHAVRAIGFLLIVSDASLVWKVLT